MSVRNLFEKVWWKLKVTMMFTVSNTLCTNWIQSLIATELFSLVLSVLQNIRLSDMPCGWKKMKFPEREIREKCYSAKITRFNRNSMSRKWNWKVLLYTGFCMCRLEVKEWYHGVIITQTCKVLTTCKTTLESIVSW